LATSNFNPYTPGAGKRPDYLAGRDDVIQMADNELFSVMNGKGNRPTIYWGYRGVGKTVLLNTIEENAKLKGFICDHIEISENDNFKLVIASRIRKILYEIDRVAQIKGKLSNGFRMLKSFSLTIPGGPELNIEFDPLIGCADSGIFQNDLTDLFQTVGEIAKENEKQICFYIDELQYMNRKDLEALVGSLHRISQTNLPICFFGAGLPSIHQLLGETKSYSERLFNFIKIDSLEENNAKNAIIIPAQGQNVTFSPEAVGKIVSITEGYPYFLQQFGHLIWDMRDSNDIQIQLVENAISPFWKILDDGFFRVRALLQNSQHQNSLRIAS
jgi:hypothetical protein